MNRLIRWAEQTPSIVSALSGIAGGLAMALYEMTATAIAEGDFWAPLHMIAAAVPESELIGSGAGRAALGLLIHLITAAFWGTRYGYVFSYAPRGLHGRSARCLSVCSGVPLCGCSWASSSGPP
jgi:hypothetical protein